MSKKKTVLYVERYFPPPQTSQHLTSFPVLSCLLVLITCSMQKRDPLFLYMYAVTNEKLDVERAWEQGYQHVVQTEDR